MVDRPTFERLAELARENERSASAEARLAIKHHLKAAKREELEREKAAA